MKRTLWASLLLGGLLLTAFFALSRAEAATRERQDGAGTCAFCNGSGVDPEAPWHRFASRPCRQCGGTGIHQPSRVGRQGVVASDDGRPTGALREFG
jgi:hypothetical protein